MKKNNKKGFTLAELLIVVAIIAVLVAIAIPVFTSRLEQSRETTDIANLRSAYAAGQVAALSGATDGSTLIGPQSLKNTSWWFNPNDADGLQKAASTALKGQGTETDGHANTSALPKGIVSYTTTSDVRTMHIKLKFDSTGLSSVKFE